MYILNIYFATSHISYWMFLNFIYRCTYSYVYRYIFSFYYVLSRRFLSSWLLKGYWTYGTGQREILYTSAIYIRGGQTSSVWTHLFPFLGHLIVILEEIWIHTFRKLWSPHCHFLSYLFTFYLYLYFYFFHLLHSVAA